MHLLILAISSLQGFNNEKLIGMTAVLLFLLGQKYRNKDEVKRMSYGDQRNTMVVELHNRIDKTIRKLSGKSNKQLVELGDAMIDDGRTVVEIISLTWNINRAKRVGTVPEILADKTYDNCRGAFPLQHSFKYQKTISRTTKFESTDTVNWKFTNELSFESGVPFLKASGKLSFEIGSSRTWTHGTDNSISQTYTKTSTVAVPPGEAAKRKASMTIEKISVPYKMKIKNKLGSIRIITGVWNGVTLTKSTDTQFRVPC